MSRGNRRSALYKDRADYLHFLEIIGWARDCYQFKVHSLCLMTNHFHMEIETGEDELWKVMQKILHPYSMDFNNKYKLTGHVFESRYIASIIEDERYFLEVSRYIHLNPVKARIVRKPLDYEYSSYGLFIKKDGREKRGIDRMFSELIETGRVLGAFRHESQEQYRMFVEGKISHADQELLIRREMKEDDMWLPW